MPYKYNALLAKLIQEVPPKSNFASITAPGVTDDSSSGYSPGSNWANLITDKAYVCLDSTIGAAVWTETTAGAAGGETNTASNVGTAGVGVYKQKTGVDFELKKINAGSSQITITDDPANNEIDIDIGVLNNITADQVDFNVLGTPTYQTAQDWFNIIQTAGIISGFTLSNARNAAELDVAAGTGIVKTADSSIGASVSFDFAGVTDVLLTDNNINYIYLDYNVGTPQVAATTDRTSIELNRQFILGRVYKDAGTLHILNSGVHLPNLARTEHERLVEIDGFTHASGAITSKVGALDLAVTEGVWYLGHNRITTGSFDSSGADTWTYTHYGLASWIIDNAAASLVDATHYNAGTDALGNLTVNAYGTQWVYLCECGDIHIIYGTENGTLASAEAAAPPTSIPLCLSTMGELIAKIIVRQTGVITSIGIVHDVQFTSSGVPNHNDTGGLQGGAAGEYYHMTSAKNTVMGNTSGTNSGDEDDASIATIIVGTAAKATPIDADTIPLIDSADASSLKEVLWSQIKATLKTYNDTLYNKYVHPNHTGEVTSVADGAQTIINDAVTYAKMQNVSADERILGNVTAIGSPVAELTKAQVLTMLNVTDGADVTNETNIASSIVGTDAKATPIDADTIPLIDSADASSLKEVLWSQIKATLKTYNDTLYNKYVHPNHTGDVTSIADGATTIAASAVDIAMLANGTDGELITWDAAGAPDTVAVGDATHVLTSNGIGLAPTFQAAAGGASLVNQILYAEAAYLPATNPAVLVEEAGATTYGGFSYLTFDDTTSETAIWRIPVPDYDGGNIIVTAFSKVATTPVGAVTLQYNILTIGLSNSEAFDAALLVDTTVNISHSLDATELLTDIMIASATIDPANVSADDLLVIGISRDVANDTLTGDGELVAIMLEYTRA